MSLSQMFRISATSQNAQHDKTARCYTERSRSIYAQEKLKKFKQTLKI
jgi:hypothetical protein